MDINQSNKYRYFFVGLIGIWIYLLPELLLRGNGIFLVHDNIEGLSNVRVFCKYLSVFYPSSLIREVMNGIPSFCLGNAISIIILPFLFLKPLSAYLVSDFLLHTVAFVGMYLLLQKHYLLKTVDKTSMGIVSGVSFCFAILPFFTLFGISIAGQPLLLYAIINIYQKKYSLYDYIIFSFFPFYSLLALSGFAILFCLGAFVIFILIRNRKPHWPLIYAFIALIAGYAIANFELIYIQLFSKSFVSHRTDWDVFYKAFSFYGMLYEGIKEFIFGFYHAASLHLPILLPVSILLCILFLRNKATVLIHAPPVKILLF